MILAIVFRPFGLIAPKTLNYLTFQYFDLSVPDEGYSRNASCTLNLISTFYCNQFLSPLMLWVRLPLRVMSTTLCDQICQ